MQPEYTERLLHPKMEYYRECYKNSERWDGESSLNEKTVIVYGEQGYGDIIQFLRYIPLLQKYGCKIILHIPTCLHSLIDNLIGGKYSCIDKNDFNLPEHDYHIPSMSLPFLLGTHSSDHPYLKIDEKLNVELDDYFKIGIAWEGNPNHSNNHDRCCPLGVFRKLHNMPKTKLFMVQKEVQEQKLIEGSSDLEILGVELTDFQSTAKLLNIMDVIVSVDTSVLHLAGALGKKAYCLLSYNHDPRWDLDIEWYPTMKFIKQKNTGDWLGVASEINMHVEMDRQKWCIKNPVIS